jgi:hypothetical protein
MVSGIIGGPYYDNTGIVLPYRSGTTEIRLETNSVNTEFGVYLNGVFNGSVVSDVNGNVIFKRLLPKGEVEIKLLNRSNGQYFTSYVTVRDYALWLVAYAEALEQIDDNLQEVFNNMAIETATIDGIEDKFGKAIQVYNDIGQDLESYRWGIQELRMGFRNFGSRFLGLDLGVASFTQVPPFGYSRRLWGPNWILDESMLINHRFLERSHSFSTSGNITGVSFVAAEPDVVQGLIVLPHSLSYNATSKTLSWDGGPLTPVADGALFLPGPEPTSAIYILGEASFAILNAGPFQNDKLYFDVDNKGPITVTLTTGLPTPTPAQVAGDINAAFVADPRYGAPYGGFASVYNTKILLELTLASNTKIVIEHGPDNGAAELFGVSVGNILFTSDVADGIEIVSISGPVRFFETAILEYAYDDTLVPPRSMRWQNMSVAGWSAWHPIPEDGIYEFIDGGGVIIKINCTIDDMEVPVVSPNTYSYSFTMGYQRLAERLKQEKGLHIVCDVASLPVTNKLDAVSLHGDDSDGYPEGPDYWRFNYSPTASSSIVPSTIINARSDPWGPAPAYAWRIEDAAATSIVVTTYPLKFPLVDETPRGTASPQKIPGGVYDYEGFELKVSGWVKSLNAGAITATLSFSWDGGTTWPASGAATPIVEDAGGSGYETPTYISYTTQLPSSLTYPNLVSTDGSVLVKIEFAKAGANMSIELDAFTLEVIYISSRYLTRATVARSRQRQYFGELDWVWSPDELSTREQVYLGLQHKLVDRTNPFGGVIITNVSTDTPNGAGTLTYEYNDVGSTHRLKWEPYGTSYAPTFGWTPIISDGSYTLVAPDSSELTVSINYSILPVLSGTPPAAERTRSITVSDQTTTQGVTRRIMPAHSSLDIADVTDYVGTYPINLHGAISESDFSIAGLVNLDIAAASPFRFSYLYPQRSYQEGEALTFAPVGPNYQATLTYACDQDQVNTLLYEDGVVFPNDLWSFIDSTTIEIVGASYDLTASYTVDYNLVYQLTTTIMNLGVATYTDYIWFADYFLWDRFDNVLGEYEVETPLFVNIENGRAYLTKKSNMNRATATLTVVDANETYEISKRYWRFLNDTTIEIDLSRIVAGQYYLTHEEKRVYESSRLTTVFEHRSGINSVATAAASWSTIERNSNVQTLGGLLCHQLRLSVSGIRDIRDFKLRGAFLKGLRMYGTDPDIPGLTNVWGLS